MANVLDKDKQVTIIGALAEGSSIRSIERMSGVHRDTIMRLGVKVGKGCAGLLNYKMRNLPCQNIQVDDLWGFIGKKERHVQPTDDAQFKSVPVKEIFQGQIVWLGTVEVFKLKGHPKTDKAYAWAHDTDDPLHPKRQVTVLHILPITSPELAVRAAIAKEYRDREQQQEN